MRLVHESCSLTSMPSPLAAFLFSWSILLAAPTGDVTRNYQNTARAELEPAPDPLLELNQTFRSAYARCRQNLVSQSGPVIVVEGDNLVLLHAGRRREAKVIPDIYHTLKAVSHAPLAVYVMLVQHQDGPLDRDILAALRSLRTQIVRAETCLKDRGLTEKVLRRQEDILRDTLRFLDDVLDKKQVSAGALLEFTTAQGRPLLANAADAACAELKALDGQVRAWRTFLLLEEWKKLHVIVMGSALPRTGNLATQYFARLLGEKGEGKRIVYAESIFDETRAVNLLGTHFLDTQIGTAFFRDPQRMYRDLLADAAKEQLGRMTFEP